MSVGFVGSSYQSIADSTGSGARLDASLQGVLSKYDSIKTDLDRLANNASYNTYDITSRQQYNAYNKESQNGWAESWYSEYKAVLQLRADALKKKLERSYNQVLEKSVFTEIKPDNQSVFAPYANRTASLTQTDFQTPVSEILVKDVAIGSVATVAPPATPTSVDFTDIATYLASPKTPLGSSATPTYPATTPAPGISPNLYTTPITPTSAIFSSNSDLAAAQYEALYNAIADSFATASPPIPNPPLTNSDKKRAKLISDAVIAAMVAMQSSVSGLTIKDYILPYGRATSIMNPPPTGITQPPILGNTVALPPPGATIAGYAPDSYSGTPFDSVITPQPNATNLTKGLFIDTVTTVSMPQDQNNTLTGNGYLFDVDLSGFGASITIDGKDAAGNPATLNKVAMLTVSAGTPFNKTGTAPNYGLDETTGITYPIGTISAPATGNTTGADFVAYGSAPPVYTVMLDNLPIPAPTTASISSQLKSLFDAGKLAVYNTADISPTGPTIALTQLPPAGAELVFKSRFPTSWYIKSDPRLGLQGGGKGVASGFVPAPGSPAVVNPGFNPTAPSGANDYIDREYYDPSQNPPFHMQPDGLYTMLRMAGDINPPVTPPAATTAPPSSPPATTPPNGAGSGITYDAASAGGSYDKAIGNAELSDGKNYSNIRVEVPQYGTGVILDPNKIFAGLPPDVRDTMIKDPSIMADLQLATNDMVNSFVGRQYDDIVGGNYYDGQFDCTDTSPLISVGIGPPFPVGPSGLAISAVLDKVVSKTLSLLYAGNGTLWGLLPPPLIATAPTPADTSMFTVGIGPDANFGHLSAVNDAGGFVTPIPTVGVFSMGGNVPIPIPVPPTGLPLLTLWVGIRRQKTRDVAAEFIEKFLAAVKPLVVEAVQTQAYSASSGTAFDTYASRGEYHFSTPGYLEAMKNLNLKIFGIKIPIGTMLVDFVKGGGFANLVGLGNAGWGANAYNTDINGVSAGTRLFDYQHSVQGAETRETDSGAFFATQSFLSQFQLKNMESEYWIGTQQNEEVVNNDMLRSIQTAGGQLMNMMTRVLSAAASAGNFSPMAGFALTALVSAIESMNAKAQQEMWYKMLYGDINYNGSGLGTNGNIRGEGFDYIENDHKPFEGDSNFNYPDPPPQNLGTMVAGILGANSDLFTAKKPDFIIEGYAATRRFRKVTDTSNAVESVGTDALTPGNAADINGYGARSHAGRGAASPSGSDTGFWTDTPLGDINEVYVGTRKVVFNNLDQGFGAFDATAVANTGAGGGSSISNTGNSNGTNISATSGVSAATRKTFAYAQRMTGADTRAFGARYDGGTPINFESFNTGLYSDGSTTGSRYHYDRRNQYSLSFQTSASNNVVNLQGSQALNPTIGGFIKMAEIDKNKTDDALLQYESVDKVSLLKTSSVNDNVLNLSGQTRGTNEQKFGASADGELNSLNQTLYEAMHLRADGRNLSEFNEYRDVFNMGYMKNIFISGQSYHPSGGGVTSSIEIRYDNFSGTNSVQSDTRENYDSNANFDPYNTLSLNKSRGKASIYLNNYFAYKKRANKK